MTVQAAKKGGLGPSADPFPACRFYVRIDGINHAVFTEMSGLQLEIDVMSVEEGGNNATVFRLPGRMKGGNLTLKRGITRSNEFCKWMFRISAGRISRKDVSVVLFDSAGEQVHQWDFIRAFPLKWSCSSFRADSSEVAMEELQLAYETVRISG